MAQPLRSDVSHVTTLLLDARGVEWPRSSNHTVVTLASLKPCVCNGLQKALLFSDNVEASDPGIQEERAKVSQSCWPCAAPGALPAGLRSCVRLLVSVLSIIMHVSP